MRESQDIPLRNLAARKNSLTTALKEKRRVKRRSGEFQHDDLDEGDLICEEAENVKYEDDDEIEMNTFQNEEKPCDAKDESRLSFQSRSQKRTTKKVANFAPRLVEGWSRRRIALETVQNAKNP